MHKWSFFTDHAIVLGQIAKQPGSTLLEIASTSGISYRALRKAINDLDKDRYIIRKREGRQLKYSVNPEFQPQKNTNDDSSLEYFCSLW